MGEPEIANEEHSRNLFKVSHLPAGDLKVKEIETELRELIGRYHGLLTDLFETVQQYKQTATRLDVPGK